jgi:RNA polymerase sigma factor (sigma-70 family)
MGAVLDYPSPAGPGAEGAVTALCRRVRPPLRRFFAGYRLSPPDVEDLIQEVFLRLARPMAIADLRDPDAFVFTVARNLLRDRSRRLHIRVAARSVALDDIELASGTPTPDVILAQQERLDRANAALDALKPATRRAFLRRRLDGHPYAEIAAEMGISVSMVEKHVMCAIAALRCADA